MGLHDRIKGPANGTAQLLPDGALTVVEAPVQQLTVLDPYAELKTRIHHACISKLGPQLFTTQTSEELAEQVTRTVTEELTG